MPIITSSIGTHSSPSIEKALVSSPLSSDFSCLLFSLPSSLLPSIMQLHLYSFKQCILYYFRLYYIINFSILFTFILAEIVFFIYFFASHHFLITEPKRELKALKSLKSKWIPDNVNAVWRKENTGGVKKEIHIITFIYIYIYSYHSSRGSPVSGASARGGGRIYWKEGHLFEIIEI